MDVGENSSLRDGDVAEELVQLFVVSDGELDVTRDDSGSLVVLGGVAGEFEKLGGEVLEYRGHVDRSSRAGSLGKATLAEVASHAADGKLETCLGAPGRGLSFLSSFLSFPILSSFLVLLLDSVSGCLTKFQPSLYLRRTELSISKARNQLLID